MRTNAQPKPVGCKSVYKKNIEHVKEIILLILQDRGSLFVVNWMEARRVKPQWFDKAAIAHPPWSNNMKIQPTRLIPFPIISRERTTVIDVCLQIYVGRTLISHDPNRINKIPPTKLRTSKWFNLSNVYCSKWPIQ